ncbi:MAG TPA: protein translocase subunit SecD, partial [Mycobacterium sp.]|nr:protein translocase subunit SecD [Mycobacterium sp.]
MASSSVPVHPARWLTLFLVLLVGAYLLVFLTGDKQPEPKLGIDLQGGTRVTLTARTPDGSPPTRDALNQAQQIINDRVNGLGVAGSEVIIDGNNLVITVPGDDSSEARNLGQTARLYIRPVVGRPFPAEGQEQQPPAATPPGAPPGAPPAAPGLPPIAPAEPGAPVAPQLPAEQQPAPPEEQPAPPAQTPAPQPRPYPQQPPPTPAPPPTPGAPTPTPGPTPPPAPGTTTPPAPGEAPLAQRIADEKQLR